MLREPSVLREPVVPEPLTAQQRRQRRQLLRRHHPDLGGDPSEFISVLHAFPYGACPRATDEVVFVTRRRGLRGLAVQYRARRAGQRRVVWFVRRAVSF